MALSPEDADRIPKLAFDEVLVDAIEAQMDREMQLRMTSDCTSINLYLNDMGFTEVGDAELYELKRRYSTVGWEVEASPTRNSYRITLSSKRFYWKGEYLKQCERMIDDCEILDE
jgi:hypothetical protein